ncbi:MAG: O-antigen ligase family protein [Bacteroidales bacterium]
MKEKIFSILVFSFIVSLGLIAPVIVDPSKIILGIGLLFSLFYFRTDLLLFLKQKSLERVYLIGTLSFAIYGLLLVIIFAISPNSHGLKPTFSPIEHILFAFVLYPLFTFFTAKNISQQQFNRIIFVFIIGNVLAGFFLLYNYHGFLKLFQSPSEYFLQVFSKRFMIGEGKFAFANPFVKHYTFYVGIAAILSLLLTFRAKKSLVIWSLMLFLCNLLFLLFTLNKDGILALVLIAPIILGYYFTRLSFQKKILLPLTFCVGVGLVSFLLPNSLKIRFHEMTTEIKAFQSEGHDSGSTSIRLTIWKILIQHSPDYCLFGDGPIYANKKLHQYFKERGYQSYIDATHIHHNDYFYFFHHYGIIGLLFLFFLLGYSFYFMAKSRKFSISIFSINLFFLIMLMADTYCAKSQSMIMLFWIYLGVFAFPKWIEFEKYTKKISQKKYVN